MAQWTTSQRESRRFFGAISLSELASEIPDKPRSQPKISAPRSYIYMNIYNHPYIYSQITEDKIGLGIAAVTKRLASSADIRPDLFDEVMNMNG